ncbi:Crp/Fnr family transcriptional regulator [Clostridium hydrogenum]|uniref:Crp/Fnr family transcriptional regulator n=1 Tax=Clostridium hydrogenum TaxID=2855764 RepID=UPI001F3DDF29|nr:Crp/Fnr family transcriptional regulator [Clostridium hydrogenum]
MDTKVLTSLKKCILFSKFNDTEIGNCLSIIKYSLKNYSKGETTAIEDDPCTSIGILISGSVEIQKIYESGKSLTLATLNTGNTFGEVIIFSNKNTYPSTITTCEKTEIMFIPKESILKLCSENTTFLNGFMSLLSNKILMLNKKVKNMSYQTIRQKLSNYILEEYKNQKNLIIKINYSKKQWAEQLGIPRPSLSRELINMREEGIINFDKNSIEILDLDVLEETLY